MARNRCSVRRFRSRGGGTRKLGIPTVLDRLIQQALLQVLQGVWEKTFARFSFGYRPRRSTHQAVGCAQKFLREGCEWEVDFDPERFSDRVVHDVLMVREKKRVQDRRVRKFIDRYLKSGVMAGVTLETTEGGDAQHEPARRLLGQRHPRNLLQDSHSRAR